MKYKIVLGSLLLLFIGTISASAQEITPCYGSDLDNGDCPLDTWVIVLVVVVSAFAMYKLYCRRKQVA